MDDGKNRGVGADAEGERQDGNCGEAGRPSQGADGVADVVAGHVIFIAPVREK
jgi:hypothetical protein